MGQAKSLSEIRSDACNQALTIIAAAGSPVVGLSFLQAMIHGWRPVNALHGGLLAVLLLTKLWRQHVSFIVRASLVTAALLGVGIGGILSFGLGTGAVVFFISASVFAGCMFDRRIAFALTAGAALVVAAIFLRFRAGVPQRPVVPAIFLADVTGWITLAAAFAIAALIPLVAMSAIMHALDLQRQRADAALEIRSEFLARMSHELRTPMTGIIGMADLLGITNLDVRQRGMITRLTQSARDLLTRLNDLLDFSKIDSGRMDIEAASFAVSRVIAEVCDLFAMAAAQKGIALTVRMPSEMHDHVLGDGYRVGQILSNLINNAIKFTDHGKVEVQVDLERRDVEMVLLTVSVTDTGIGITAPQLAELFQPFVQVDVSISRRYGGTGLGLAISRSLAEAMGGAIDVSSEPGVGSRFRLTLPLKVDSAASIPARSNRVKPEVEAEAGVTFHPPAAIHRGP